MRSDALNDKACIYAQKCSQITDDIIGKVSLHKMERTLLMQPSFAYEYKLF